MPFHDAFWVLTFAASCVRSALVGELGVWLREQDLLAFGGNRLLVGLVERRSARGAVSRRQARVGEVERRASAKSGGATIPSRHVVAEIRPGR